MPVFLRAHADMHAGPWLFVRSSPIRIQAIYPLTFLYGGWFTFIPRSRHARQLRHRACRCRNVVLAVADGLCACEQLNPTHDGVAAMDGMAAVPKA